MKKILITIASLTVVCIVFFLIYYPKAKTRPDVVYHSLVTSRYENIVYNESEGMKLDILMPTNEVFDEIPYIVYIHDGDFTDGDKADLLSEINQEVVFNILDMGYAIITVNYSLLDGSVHFPANLVDIKDALRFLNKHAVEYNLDSTNVGIWGIGSGGYLALTAAYSAPLSFTGQANLSIYNSHVNYVIAMNSLTELNKKIDIASLNNQEIFQTQSRLDILFGEIFDINNLDDQAYEDMGMYNPIEYVSFDTVPTLLFHGTSDEVYNVSYSEDLETKLKEYSINYQFHKLDNITHDLREINSVFIDNISTKMETFLNDNYQEITS